MGKTSTKIICRATALPIVQYGLGRFYPDLGTNRFRDIENRHNFIHFDSEQGRIMCERIGIIVCRNCGMSVIVSGEFDLGKLHCMQCQQLIVPLFAV